VFKELLSPEVQKYVREHEHDDPRQLILQHKTILGIPAALIVQQIIARAKAKSKLPLYYRSPEIIFPPGINLEQSSSEITAKFKTEIVPALRNAADLTGGFGIDSFFLSRVSQYLDYVEMNDDLLKIARHNHKVLGAENIRHYNATAADYVKEMNDLDLVFIDPSRRTENRKVFSLTDSEPDIVDLQSPIFEKSKYILVKASPLLDLKLALKQLQFVKHVYVVSVDNEVKELLFLSERNHSGEPLIEAVNLSKEKSERFAFRFSDEESATILSGDPQRYLYEPFSSVLKAGAFKSLAKTFPVTKIQTNTHLYTSDKLVQDFPGRIFEIEDHIKPDKKSVSKYFPEGKANVLTRNYPSSAEELKKKTGLTDGGERYLIGFSTQKEKAVIVASRIK
jgi:hypothetical protein